MECGSHKTPGRLPGLDQGIIMEFIGYTVGLDAIRAGKQRDERVRSAT